MAYLRCDECGASTDTQGSWDTPIKILCEKCGSNTKTNFNNMDKIPEIGKTYNCFDDGKIRLSRLYTVDVKEIIPFKEIDDVTLEEWKSHIQECDWLFATKTDYFIKTENGEEGDAVFVRTKDGGWFSMGSFMNSGRLDVDGKLTETL